MKKYSVTLAVAVAVVIAIKLFAPRVPPSLETLSVAAAARISGQSGDSAILVEAPMTEPEVLS